MSFLDAGEALIGRLERGVYEAGKDLMTISLEECPISGPTTYIAEWGTKFRTINGQIVYFDDENPYIVGDQGTLRRSGRVFPPVRTPDEISVTVGYGFGAEVNPAGRLAAEYAVPVHERSELHHPMGKSHYLLDPALAFAAVYPERIAAAVDEPVVGEFVEVEGTDLQAGL